MSDNWQANFEVLKEYLIKNPILKFSDFEKEFFVETDASLVGLGEVLSQLQDDGGFKKRFIVAYARWPLRKSGKN